MTFEAEVRCLVFARVYVDAGSEAEARDKIRKGGGYWSSAEFDTHTAEIDELESITNLDRGEPEEEPGEEI